MEKNKLIKFLPFIALALAIVAPLILKARFQQHILVLIVLYAVMAEAWNIMAGYAGMVSIGQAAFFGIGAYASTVLFVKYQVNPWIGLIIGGFATALFATIIGLPFSRLRGRYFGIGTIALAQMIKVVFENWPLVGGAAGMIIPMTKEGFWNLQFHSSKLGYYYIALTLLVAVVVFMYIMERSKMGFYFKAIRENEEVATGLGVNKTVYKLIAIAISAGITGVCGSLLAQYSLYVEPAYMFDHTISVTIALTAVFGGAGNIVGPILGSLILMPISELTRAWMGSGGSGVDLMIYGAFIVLICVYEPDGLMGIARKTGRRLKARRERGLEV
jgi:branched-chain amino acid transport system permease protein